jgi:iron complex outermembrane recepter protein
MSRMAFAERIRYMLRAAGIASVAVGLLTRIVAMPAMADTAPAPPESTASSTQLQEVIVTAARAGAQNVQDVPMAISVVKPDDILRLGLTGVEDYSRLVPGLSLQENGPLQTSIDIRGIVTTGVDITNVQDRSLVAIYYDDTPITLNSVNPDLKVFDLERVEVLKGPQGTLYGAGAMAGTIRLITKKPDSENFSSTLETTVSDTTSGYGGLNDTVRGMVNLPLVQGKLAVRITGYQEYDTGFIKNAFTTLPDGQESGTGGLNDYKTQQARIAVAYTPLDDLRVDASMTYAHLEAGVNDGYDGLPPYEYTTLEPIYDTDDFRLYNVTVAYDKGGAHFSNSTSYLDRDVNPKFSNDPNGPEIGIPIVTAGLSSQPSEIHDLIDEPRVTGTSGALKWTVGAFYEHFIRHFVQDSTANDLDAEYAVTNFYGVPIPGYNSVWDGAFHSNDDFSGLQNVAEYQLAEYGELTYTVLSRLDLTAGLRHFDWHQEFNLYYGGLFGCNPCTGETNPATGMIYTRGTPLTQAGDASASGNTPRFSAAYHLNDDAMVYAEAGKGFRYGGVNQPVPLSICLTGVGNLQYYGQSSAPLTFGPDELWQYSLGEKSSLLDHRLTLNVDTFLIDWEDVQTTQYLECSYYYTVNKGHITSKGVELETTARATERLSLSLSASYTNAYANGDISNIDALDGERAPFFPRQQASATATYTIPLPEECMISLDGNFTYKGSSYSTFNPTNPMYAELPASRQLNASINYGTPRYEVGLFGTNLTNGNVIIDYTNIPTYMVGFQPGRGVVYARPRTIGLRFAVKL